MRHSNSECFLLSRICLAFVKEQYTIKDQTINLMIKVPNLLWLNHVRSTLPAASIPMAHIDNFQFNPHVW